MKNANANSAGSFSTLLLLLFIALKLTGHITWSWWWVLSPIWIPIVVTGLLFGVWVVAVYIKKKKTGKGSNGKMTVQIDNESRRSIGFVTRVIAGILDDYHVVGNCSAGTIYEEI